MSRAGTTLGLPEDWDVYPGAWSSRRRFEAGQICAVYSISECLERIEVLDGEIRAFTHVARDEARAAARVVDRTAQTKGPGACGPLAGIPVAFKDNFDTADMPAGLGCDRYRERRPARDAAAVAMVRDAGGVVLGKTVTTEFAHRHPGPTRNPRRPDHTPGGSSSGSAAAVAAGMVPIAFGSQTTGSVIRPAAYCGVIGYKPTWGQFSTAGMLANAPSFDTVGVFSRALEDLVLVRRALLDESVPALSVPGLGEARVGIVKTPFWERAGDDAKAFLEAGRRMLAEAGASVSHFDEGRLSIEVEEANRIVAGYEFARVLAHERRVALDALSPVLREGRMRDGLKIPYSAYIAAERRLEAARIELDRRFSEFDFLISLSARDTAPEGLGSTGTAEFNMLWTTLHVPVVTLPIGRASNGLPLGLQMAGARYEDDRLLGAAKSVMDRVRELAAT